MPFADEIAGGVVVHDYRSDWPGDFARLNDQLTIVLEPFRPLIQHVGSTAVPGLAAKDCIDVQVLVDSVSDPGLVAGLEGAGFRRRPELWNSTEVTYGRPYEKLVFAPAIGARPCNVHVRERNAAARYALLFRDFLRADECARTSWGAFKQRLARTVTDIYDYGQIKAPAIEVLMLGAERWAAETGWEPFSTNEGGAMFSERGMTAGTAWARTRPKVDVLFLHGWSDSIDCWSPLLAHLDDDLGYLAIDAPGHGRSPAPDQPADTEAMADAAARALADQEIPANGVVVVGHSMGAATAAALAERHPELVRALVLEDPPFPAPPVPEPSAARGPMPDWLREIRELDTAAKIARGAADHPSWPEDELEPWAISKEQYDPRGRARPGKPVPLTERLPKLRCPVLLIHGDVELGSIVSPEAARACEQAAASELTIVHLAGAGHNVRREQRAAYVESVTNFLAAYRRE